MKKTVLMVAVITAMIFTSCKKENASTKVKSENVEAAVQRDAKSGDLPVIKWDKTEHDFGTIKQGEKPETIFTLTNTGKADLIITNAKGSCGCTVPEWPKEAIKPGETGQIKVVYNSRGKKNKTTNTITLTTNTEKGLEVVRIKAFVNAPKTATPQAKVPNMVEKN